MNPFRRIDPETGARKGLLPPLPAFVHTLTSEWERLQITALASQIAFSAVFAIPPLIFFIMSIASLVNTYTGIPVAEWLREQIEERAPDQVTALLLFIVDEAIDETSGGFASAGAILAAVVAIYSASGVINAIVNASNRAFGVPDRRNFLVKRIYSVAMLLGMTVLLLVAGVLAIGIEGKITDFLIGTEIGGWLWSILRWPISVAVLAGALVLLYYVGLVANPPLRWTVPGAFLAAIALQLLVWVYSGAFGVIDPGSPYGATGSVLVLLSFLYATGIILILGAALNGIILQWMERRRTTADAERSNPGSGQQPPGTPAAPATHEETP